MNIIEKKLDAVMRYITTESGSERHDIREEIRALLKCDDAPPANRNL